ncbi:MAG: pyridoxamine 5'-phosphate oxidase family protein [Candidatus Omnitrophota bacterium]
MQREELKVKIIKLIEEAKLGSLATINEGRPWVRYMVIHPDKGSNGKFGLYSTTFANSRKVAQINQNPNVHIAIGGDPHNWQAPYLNIRAQAKVVTDIETKKNCWCDMLKQFFSGPEDDNYAVIKISPQIIEYMSPGARQPEVYEVIIYE